MHDVRMKGCTERTDVEEVLGFVAGHVQPLAAEPVGLNDAVGRVLAEPVRAEVNVPCFRRSAMDGYAVRGEDTFGADGYAPIELRLLGTALP